MDSLTQATLGAAVAHACWHRPLGRRAMLWGAALGTLPDLDIVLYPLLDEVQELYWHRGESHSVFFAALGGILIGWLLWRGRWRTSMTARRAVVGVSLIFVTHILIDYFTVYGTQLLAPLSRHGFGRGNLFIIDPLYTAPLLIGVLVAALSRRRDRWRANLAGIVLSSLYALFSLASHAHADRIFTHQLSARNIQVLQSVTTATPMNALLWRHIARTPEGILVGYFSVLADRPDTDIGFELLPRNEHLIEPYRHQRNVRAVEWFSKGFWVADEDDGAVTLSDVRFGELRLARDDPPDEWQFIFVWEISGNPDDLVQRSPEIRDPGAAMAVLWRRLKDGVPGPTLLPVSCPAKQ